MKTNFRSLSGWLVLSALAMAPLATIAQPAVQTITATKPPIIPVETFMRRAEYASMSISPNGDRLAALIPMKDRDNLVVIDLVKRTRVAVTNFTDNDVINFSWINNDRLFLRVADGKDALGEARYRGTFAVNADGSGIRNLTDLRGLTPLRSIAGDTKGEILAVMRLRNRVIADVYRLNTITGRSELLTFENPGEAQSWVLDWNDQPLLAVSPDPDSSETVTWYRTDVNAKWQMLWKNPPDDAQDSMDAVAFDPDGKSLIVSSNVGRDKYALYRYDLQTKKLGEVIFEHPLVDIRGGLIWSRAEKRLLGIGYNAEEYKVKWLDPKLATLQQQIDNALKGTNNILNFNTFSDASRILVSASSATDPGGYYLYDAARGLEELPKSRPWINPDHISPRTFMPYTARDGLKIPAWVTIPKGTNGKNLPLIVNIHGGPNVRTYGGNPWGRYSEAPFFANRGYVVLEPEPRASTGFGRKHLSLGYKQWGQTMQDDITDGVLFLIKEGIVDKNRVCLYGGSYGGYATLQGLVKEPDMFRCGLPWIAVSNLVLMQTDTNSDTNNSRYNMSVFFDRNIGSLKTERPMLEKFSPVFNADKIKAPVLLVMGELDVRVPLQHGTSMRDAMNRAGVKNELVIMKGEAHGFNKQENVVDFFTRAEKFFGEYLK
jgi:dipeptidyl aminopeptidase/acylaminoacyl peptidase